VRRALLVAGQHVPQPSGRLVDLVVDVEHRAAGIAEDRIHALLFENFHQYLRASQFHGIAPPDIKIPPEPYSTVRGV
jgi:hypothetical protein